MPAKITFLAVVPETIARNVVVYKAFFYCRKTSQLLAIPVNKCVVEFLIRKNKLRITAEECIITYLIKNLHVKRITIVKTKDTFESLFNYREGCWFKTLKVPFYYAFIIAKLCEIPLELDQGILNKEGIYITKEMLSDTLIESFGKSLTSANT